MNYAALKAHFRSVLNRRDITDSLVTTFLEQAIARAQRTLRLPSMERLDLVTVGDTFDGIDIPSDMIELIAVYVDQRKLRQVGLGSFLELPQGAGTPAYYTRLTNKIMINPAPAEGTVIKILYYGEFEPLVSDTDETTLSAIAPDLIVYGALSYAADHFLDERKADFEARFAQAMAEIMAQAVDTDWGGGTMAISPAYQLDGDY